MLRIVLNADSKVKEYGTISNRGTVGIIDRIRLFRVCCLAFDTKNCRSILLKSILVKGQQNIRLKRTLIVIDRIFVFALPSMKCIKEKRTTIVAVREQLQQQQQQNSSSTRTRSAFPTLSFMAITLWLLLLQSTFVAAQTDFNEGKFNALIEKLESDVVKFARQLESFYVDRCQDIQLERCSAGNYDDCQSAYPNPQCLAGESYHVPVCGDEIATNGDGCSGLVDFSISTVRIPTESALGEDKNPTDPQVIETVCYTQAMDEWLQAKRVQDQAYWDEFGVEPWAWYFGSHTGVFRLWPGRQAETCGSYDPRTRPWCKLQHKYNISNA